MLNADRRRIARAYRRELEGARICPGFRPDLSLPIAKCARRCERLPFPDDHQLMLVG